MPTNQHRHKKRFGQHFLHDSRILDLIVRCIQPQEHDHLVEIGPGQGVLTAHLVKHAKRLDAIEIDRDLVQFLQQQFIQNNVFFHQADILKFDLTRLPMINSKIRIVGNLPYNISTPILFKLFKHLNQIQDMFFLLQREVVVRMAAQPNNKQYGRLSIMTQYHCQTEQRLDVPANASTPPPKVESSVVQLTPHTTPPCVANDFTHFSHLVRDAFNYRRKTIQNALKGHVDANKLMQMDINPKRRPQELTVKDYVNISNTITATAR